MLRSRHWSCWEVACCGRPGRRWRRWRTDGRGTRGMPTGISCRCSRWPCSGCGGRRSRASSRRGRMGAGLVAGRARRCNWSAGYYRLEWRLEGLALLPYLGGTGPAAGGLAVPGVGVAVDRVPRVHGPAPLAGRDRPGPAAAIPGDDRQHLCPADPGLHGVRPGVRDPGQRQQDRRDRGVQRPEHADDVRRAVRRPWRWS